MSKERKGKGGKENRKKKEKGRGEKRGKKKEGPMGVLNPGPVLIELLREWVVILSYKHCGCKLLTKSSHP